MGWTSTKNSPELVNLVYIILYFFTVLRAGNPPEPFFPVLAIST